MSSVLFKQLSERQNSAEISHLCWNPRYDLLAVGTVRGDVTLQRLFWRKVWDYANPNVDNNSSNDLNNSLIGIIALCWSPDADCLCIVYSNSTVHFLDLEHGKLVYCIDRLQKTENNEEDDEFCIVKWFRRDGTTCGDSDSLAADWCSNQDRDLIGDLPPLEKPLSNSFVLKLEKSQHTSFTSVLLKNMSSGNGSSITQLYSMLCFVTRSGQFYMYLNGYLPIYAVNLRTVCSKLLDFEISIDARSICFTYVNQEQQLTARFLRMDKLVQNGAEFSQLAARLGQFYANFQYLDQVTRQIIETWEDLLAEVSTKFTRFAREKWTADPDSTIGDELICALAFGTTSPELNVFLTRDLPEKSLKKLMQTLDNIYSNLRHLIAINLNAALSSIFYHCNQLKLHSGPDGLLDPETLSGLSSTCEAAALKASETFQIVDNSWSKFELFFIWLRHLANRLCEDTVTPGSNLPPANDQIPEISITDIEEVLKFIEETFLMPYVPENDNDNRNGNGIDSHILFKFEQIGQYLRNQDLTMISENPGADQKSGFPDQTTNADDNNKNNEEICSIVLGGWKPKSSLIQEIERLKHHFYEYVAQIQRRMMNSQDFIVLQEKSACLQPTLFSSDRSNNNDICALIKPDNSDAFRIYVFAPMTSSIRTYDFSSPSKISASTIKPPPTCLLLNPESIFHFNDAYTIILVQNYDRKTLNVLMESVSADSSNSAVSDSSLSSSSAKNYKILHIKQEDQQIKENEGRSRNVSGGHGDLNFAAPIEIFEDNDDLVKSQLLSGGPYCHYAVSGARKVSCLLYSCRTRLKILEMEPDEDSSLFNNSSKMDVD